MAVRRSYIRPATEYRAVPGLPEGVASLKYPGRAWPDVSRGTCPVATGAPRWRRGSTHLGNHWNEGDAEIVPLYQHQDRAEGLGIREAVGRFQRRIRRGLVPKGAEIAPGGGTWAR